MTRIRLMKFVVGQLVIGFGLPLLKLADDFVSSRRFSIRRFPDQKGELGVNLAMTSLGNKNSKGLIDSKRWDKDRVG
ncbi:uncharacterized protein F5891DRAFT_1035260 [Suillus fuscotomentosus]|uniref:Uncharacterized protein n=1 Tax=Suillus fuscotomentosus TaxID=1912939 RepID=A0AAD4E7M0_9AGAM|nr:uncharacterized protein F5891DRAFT_1035260 [Suillus fuscotomentosus]KAG1899929.1 hypothetical protein F5891DRAFT_1035260 [Suillus fuscotomentosus]